ncbi:uncharacterized protein N7469_010464 [Penicillium citrinum]|uniref:Uncharacterized protein n=2 Tax=Penicillium TaxID=5073 RepID=A0A9W9NKC3_PENCI|nr:uncharacterized protein N7469_010464 [Penicillium citrinum]KAJ5221577.1 hypothetical protein N7469_010464 [Penicillium citrinum]KAJ5596543.1 hypothetical protein N7450_003001 [Penicillium hetheringtonii]
MTRIHQLRTQAPEVSPLRIRSTASIPGHNTEEPSEQPIINSKYATQLGYATTPSEYPQASNHLPVREQGNSTPLAKLLEEVTILQKDVSARRMYVTHLRNALRQSREREQHMRQALRSTLDIIIPGDAGLHTQCVPPAVNNAILNLQVAMRSYQTMEVEYNGTEERLSKEEYHLDQQLTQLSHCLHNVAISITQQEQHSGTTSNNGSNYASSVQYAPHNDTKNALPEQEEYAILIQNANIIRERLEELEIKNLNLIEQQRLKAAEDLILDNEADLFFDIYEDEKEDLEEDLKTALVKIDQHPDHRKPRETAVSDEKWRDMLEEYLPDPPEDQPSPDILRASPLEDRSPFFETARPLPWNKSNFVNNWLLYRLRHSALEILNFKNQPELLGLLERGWDRDSISEMAMGLWFEDGAAKLEKARSNSGV